MERDEESAAVVAISTAAMTVVIEAIDDLDLASDTKRYQVLELVIGDLVGSLMVFAPPLALERIVAHANSVAAAHYRHEVH